jgi:plasmid stability protein
MGRMIRKQFNIDDAMGEALRIRATTLGVSQSALMRQALDSLFAGPEGLSERDARWQQLMALSEERRRTLPSSVRTWTRDEIHERP